MREAARKYLEAGLAVLPADRAGKRPKVSWKEYQHRLPDKHAVDAWFANSPDAICILAGAVSGNLEMVDFDLGGEMLEPWKELLPAELVARVVIETSQGHGWHVVYRCEAAVSGSTKLAQRKHVVRDGDEVFTESGQEYIRLAGKPYQIRNEAGVRHAMVTLIETRGEGGIFLCSPTEGYELRQGSFTDISVLTQEERETLLHAARELNEFIEIVQPPTDASAAVPDGLRPGDDYNARGDVRAVLRKHGWVYVNSVGENERWRRPGKTNNWSATFNGSVFYVFTSSTGFEAGKGYPPFAVYTFLEHKGDWKAAARTLRKEGFGGDQGNLADVNIDGIVAQGQGDKVERDPDEFSLSQLLTGWPTEAEPIIDGWLRRGEVGNLIGGPKTYKTWMLQQCIVCVLQGKPIFGNATTSGRVLLLDFELAKGTLAKRLCNVAHAMGTSVTAIDDQLTVLAKRGRPFSLDDLERYVSTCGHRFDLIAIDPLFRLFPTGMDENSNADVASLYGRLIGLAERTQAAVIVVHHMSKGNQLEKSITDMGAGAGSQSRACDLHLTLRPHSEDNAAVVAGVVRSFKPFEPFCLRYEYPIWHAAPDLDPDDLARPGRKKKTSEAPPPKPEKHVWTDEEFVEAFVTAEPSSRDVILLRANQSGIGDKVTAKLLGGAEAIGLVFRWPHPTDKTASGPCRPTGATCRARPCTH